MLGDLVNCTGFQYFRKFKGQLMKILLTGGEGYISKIIFENFKIIYNDPRRFGFFQLIKNSLDLKKRFNHLGPEPFDPNFNLTYVFEFHKQVL